MRLGKNCSIFFKGTFVLIFRRDYQAIFFTAPCKNNYRVHVLDPNGFEEICSTLAVPTHGLQGIYEGSGNERLCAKVKDYIRAADRKCTP